MASTETFVKPGSVLARTAREMVEAHAGGAGPSEGMTICPVCGEPLPCASGRAAAEVLFAAGLAESSGLIAAYRQGLGSPAGSPFGLPEPGPQAGASPFPSPAGSPVVSFDKPPHAEPLGPSTPADAPADVAVSSPDESPVSGLLVAPPAATAPDDLPAASDDLPAAPDDLPVEDEQGGPAVAPSRWGSSRKAKRSADHAPKTPPPAETARGIAHPVTEPAAPVAEPEPAIDPLLLGPPLFTQQNRPLDAPRFTRTSRPAEQLPEPGPVTRQDSWPSQPEFPAEVDELGPAAPDGSPAADPGQAEALPVPSDPLVTSPADHPGVLDHPGEPGHPGVLDHPGEPGHPGVLDHPGEPGHPGVLDHPGEPHQSAPVPPAGPPSGRAPLEAPQMGQLNRGLAGDAEKPAAELGRQTTTAPQARPHRPPLEAPQLGQLNRPLEPAGGLPIGDEPTGSGLPGRPAEAEPDPQSPAMQAPPPLEAPAATAPWAVGQDETGTPSGLSSPPVAGPEAPAAEQAAEENVPSGLPQRPDQP